MSVCVQRRLAYFRIYHSGECDAWDELKNGHFLESCLSLACNRMTLSRDSFYYAQHVVDEIMAAGYSLQEQPYRGRIVPELKNPLIRELFIYSYRLIYELKENETAILAVSMADS